MTWPQTSQTTRFYRRYRKLLQRSIKKIIDSLKADLGKVWEIQLDALQDDLNKFKGDIQSQISAISALKQTTKPHGLKEGENSDDDKIYNTLR